MQCLHANWSAGSLLVWSEVAEEDTPIESPPRSDEERVPIHPATSSCELVREVIKKLLPESAGRLLARTENDDATVLLPSHAAGPLLSPSLAHRMGQGADLEEEITLREWRIDAIRVPAEDAPALLESIEEVEAEFTDSHDVPVLLSSGFRFFAEVGRFSRALLAEQRFVPALVQLAGEPLRGVWQPWLSDEATADRVLTLLSSMPPAARAVKDELEHSPQLIVQDALLAMVDAACRRVMLYESIDDAIDGRDPREDPHVAWLSGLLSDRTSITAKATEVPDIVKRVRMWVGGLDERGISSDWELLLRINEPISLGDLKDLQPPPEAIQWTVSFALVSKENAEITVDADDIWAMSGASTTIDGLRLDEPGELLLAELSRASRIFPALERALTLSQPISIPLDTNKAYEFLREIRPLLIEQGFSVEAPDWWETPGARLGARLQLDPMEAMADMDGAGPSAPSLGDAKLGLSALVNYQWRIAVGDVSLTLKEFEQLAQSGSPLIRINNQWVEIRPEDVEAAMKFIGENPGGQMRVGEALRIAFAAGTDETGVPVLGIDATGWLEGLLDRAEGEGRMPILAEPEGFLAQLRPYQRKGLSWMSFLDRIGLGPCLADDMGLGKTIQLLALLMHERQFAQTLPEGDPEKHVGPTLIVVPMSIVDNWRRESTKFSPNLKLMIHHGVDRLDGDAFVEQATNIDIVITTYALANRDIELLERVEWHRVVLDEAQNIKNPQAKQSQAVRKLRAPRRIVLTGTPLENRLSELWSVMDFCNPGLLGGSGEFRRIFGIPIERYHDKRKAEQLRSLVQPFILRRLKTDPTVISDLPDKVETKEFCRLTPEQAELYENTVKSMLSEVERAEGIRRRGIVLTTLIRLKQICNHPAQMLKDEEMENAASGGLVQASRSGKCIRMLELLDEVVAAGDQALVFTQFRQMGTLLQNLLRQELDREVLFLHGGTPQRTRQQMIDRFQKADGTMPIFVLSLKAGGVGLNLTAASHVFHFDRWWNPAVENQATDRAFRIGQKKTVNVHKFIVSGTLEDRIDQMIESKVALAEDIIGSGEQWLTELDVTQLRDVLTLRPEAVAD